MLIISALNDRIQLAIFLLRFSTMTSAGRFNLMEQQMADLERYFHEAMVRLAREEEFIRALARRGRNSRRAVDRYAFLQEACQAIKGHYEMLTTEYRGKKPSLRKAAPASHSALLNVLVAITHVSRGSVARRLPK